MPDTIALGLIILTGLVLGSFATALSYRLPRGISMVTKTRSNCPACLRNLNIIDLIPIFSWIFLRGRCRTCKESIGLRYPIIEAATLILCLAFYTLYGFTLPTLILCLIAPTLISIIDIDLHYKIIPDSLIITLFGGGITFIILNALQHTYPFEYLLSAGLDAIGGGLVYAGAVWGLRYIFTRFKNCEPMGLGDVKFFGVAGFWFGLNMTTAALFLMLAGGGGIVIALIWKKATGEDEFPFGPALVIAFTAITCLQQPFLF